MVSVKETKYRGEILKEFNYSFADVFVFNGFVVSEIKEGVNFNWNDHASKIVKDVADFVKVDGKKIIYISNRIHSYTVSSLDWFSFFKHNYYLKGYFVVSKKPNSKLNFMVESLFFKNKIKKFNSIFAAVSSAQIENLELSDKNLSLF